MKEKSSISTENLHEIIRTPEDAGKLISERVMVNKELVNAATKAYNAYFTDIDRRAIRISEQVKQLKQQRESVIVSQRATQQALVSATVDGDADAMHTEQDRIGQLSTQLTALDAQITALNEYILQGDADLFRAAEAAIQQASEDNEAMAADVEAVMHEVALRVDAWSKVLHSYIGAGELPDIFKLHNHTTETVAEHTARLDLEATQHEEWRLAREAWEENQRKEDEERAKRESAQKPNPVRYVQTPSGIRKEIWSGIEGRYVDAGPTPGHSIFSR